MSRSYRKPYIKGTYKGAKQRSAQAVRSNVRQVLHVYLKENYGVPLTSSEDGHQRAP